MGPRDLFRLVSLHPAGDQRLGHAGHGIGLVFLHPAPVDPALAAACEGESLITGTSRLAHKESDRAETLREEYAKVGIEIDLSTPDVMRIRGGAIRPARVFSHGDHRIAMSMAVSALRSSGAITIEGAEAVAKSYPRFFEDLESLRVN